jgi:RNA polymerase sigma factor (sigma-70 family)
MTDEQRNKLVTDNKGLAGMVARKLHARYQGCGILRDDIFQECMIAMMRCCETFDAGKGKFSVYAYRAALSAAKHYCRMRAKEHRPVAILKNDRPVMDASADATLDAESLWLKLRPHLSKAQRNAVESMVMRGMTLKEYGTKCGRTRQNAAAHLIRAKQQIFRIIEEQGICADDYAA